MTYSIQVTDIVRDAGLMSGDVFDW